MNEELKGLLENKVFNGLLEEYAEMKKKYKEAKEGDKFMDAGFYLFKILSLVAKIQAFLIEY